MLRPLSCLVFWSAADVGFLNVEANELLSTLLTLSIERSFDFVDRG